MRSHLVRTGLGLVWRAAPADVVVTVTLQVLSGAGILGILLSTKEVLETGLGASSLSQTLPAIALLVGILVLVAVVAAVVAERDAVLAEKVSLYVQRQVLAAATAMNYDAFETPDLYDRLQRAKQGAAFGPLQLVQGLVMLAGSVAGTAGVVAGLAAIEPLLIPLVVLTAVPVIVAAAAGGLIQAGVLLGLATVDRERGYLVDLLTERTAAKEVRSFDLGPHLLDRWAGLSRQRLAAVVTGARRQRWLLVVGGLLSALVVGGAIALLAQLLVTGRVDVAQAGAAGAAMLLLTARMRGLSGAGAALSEAAPFITALTDLLALPPRPPARPLPPAPASFQRIRLEDVHFTYPSGGQPALRGATLELRQGEVVAVVGENGSGKTTMAKLLCALHRPTAGKITWDGVDLTKLDPASVRDRIAVLFQDFQHFHLRARDNIGFGRVDRVDDLPAIRTAAVRAGIDPALRRLPEGYESRLGPQWQGGTDLSGGQWQRLALARAFFRDTRLVVMDEPTAALDPRAERELFEAVRQLYQGRTVLLISHRFSTVRSADRILVMRDGQIVESGDHESLLAEAGLYAELYTLQTAQIDPGPPAAARLGAAQA